MHLQNVEQPLIGKLRDLEAALLRISDLDLPIELDDSKKIYEERLDQLEHSHSRSWFGDHANTYFKDFSKPPAGESFDVEWGFTPGFHGSRNRGWEVYSRDTVQAFVFDGIGENIFYAWHTLEERVTADYSIARDQALDIIEALPMGESSKARTRYLARIEGELAPYTVADYINGRIKSTPRMTRDSEEIAKGEAVPLQVQYLSAIRTVEANKRRARELAGVIRNVIEAASLRLPATPDSGAARRLFIGHGRSDQWKTLRDFVRDRLHLEFDEFNRIPVAGISNKERLSEMLDQCGFALLVMTGEDEHGDGTLHARENVIHEIGLFQGRLDWRKAIVLIEDGCREFSNLEGLGQVRYRKGDIASCFEEVRRILEREGIIATSNSVA